MKVSQWHPRGVFSNVGVARNDVRWRSVSYISCEVLLLLCAVAYPALLVGGLLLFTVVVSFCLTVDGDASKDEEVLRQNPQEPGSESPTAQGFNWLSGELPVLSKHRLTKTSQRLYACWAVFCCAVPSLMVFGTPALMSALARPYPQEVLASLTLLTTMFMFANGVHMVIFAGKGMLELKMAKDVDYSSLLPQCAEAEVLHWLILPQYKEDVEVVSMALQSVAASSIAECSIGIVLAMEEREKGARAKTKALMERFEGKFRKIVATYHPPDLPGDPPGKASNLAWAFKHLCNMMSSEEEMSKVVITVADADSEFSIGYFESVSAQFLENGSHDRYTKIWQSPVFHMKNYHRLPSPVVVGTVFTGIGELSMLSDPNAVRFPYSSYSLSMNLARRVGGWDPEWIAEDYHMGIKCFLMTLGETTVDPVMLPTINYVPEELGSWWGTCIARWTQAKRHAMGFSDFAYFFMMLPLAFGFAASATTGQDRRFHRIHGFWRLLTYGSTLIIRLINIHVFVGVLSAYGALEAVLKLLMILLFDSSRHIEFLQHKLSVIPAGMMIGGIACTLMATMIFMGVYVLLKPRIEGKAVYNSLFSHWSMNAINIAVCAPIYFIMLSYAIWQAAFCVLTQSSFEYEVAPKPVLTDVYEESKEPQPNLSEEARSV